MSIASGNLRLSRYYIPLVLLYFPAFPLHISYEFRFLQTFYTFRYTAEFQVFPHVQIVYVSPFFWRPFRSLWLL